MVSNDKRLSNRTFKLSTGIDMKLAEIKTYITTTLNAIYGAKESERMASIYLEDKYNGNLNLIDIDVVNEDLQLLIDHYPLQYITGKVYFYDSFFEISPSVLIPRPETEELIRVIIEKLRERVGLRILDIGTGSGVIAILLSKHLNCNSVIGADISTQALTVAKKNAINSSANVDFLKMDFLNTKEWDNIPGIDVLVSNPPYINKDELNKMSLSTVKYEPDIALFPKHENNLIFYEKLAQFAFEEMRKGGFVFVEINEFFAQETHLIFTRKFDDVEVIEDMQGKPRIIMVRI